jgi:DNA-binding NarL/FixJ family response regulator
VTLADCDYRQQVYDRSRHDMNNCRIERDRAILAALTEGHTHTQIAEATGLTRGRIGQIANQANTKGKQ